MLINRDSDSSVPVVFSVPPTDSICPTPPSTPASLQRLPIPTSVCSTSSTTCTSYCSQGSLSSDHQMVLPEHDEALMQSFTPPDEQIGRWGRKNGDQMKNMFYLKKKKKMLMLELLLLQASLFMYEIVMYCAACVWLCLGAHVWIMCRVRVYNWGQNVLNPIKRTNLLSLWCSIYNQVCIY